MAKFSQAIKAIAINLQESFEMREAGQMHGNVQKALSQAISDGHRDTGNYGYYVDHSGDGMAGDVIYQSGGKLKKAPYTGTKADGKSTWAVGMDKAKVVTAVTSYKEAGYVETPSPSHKPLSNEDIARLNALKESGILTADQVQSVFSSSARRESDAAANRGTVVESAQLQLTESLDWAESEAIALFESAGKTVKEIKIIAPGPGSSAFYPAEVLKRDGPKVFGKNTHIYINHATKAEEAERPEGDWHKLVGALEGPAYWKESDKHGAGLFGMAAFASDLAPTIFAKAPWSGMSIRANGAAQMEAGRVVTKGGKPVLSEFLNCESIDIVTRAGAGGMILTESATGPNKGEVEMTEQEVKALVEAGITAGLAKHKDSAVVGLLERARRGDATVIATRVLSTVTLAEASKQRVIENVLRGELPVTEAGAVDEPKLIELVNAEAKREGVYVAQLTGSGRITGMGTAPVQIDEAERKRRDDLAKLEEADEVDVWSGFGLNEAQAKAAAGKVAA